VPQPAEPWRGPGKALAGVHRWFNELLSTKQKETDESAVDELWAERWPLDVIQVGLSNLTFDRLRVSWS
jgi:hypothetical protein